MPQGSDRAQFIYTIAASLVDNQDMTWTDSLVVAKKCWEDLGATATPAAVLPATAEVLPAAPLDDSDGEHGDALTVEGEGLVPER